jgi:hypothetical protein
VRTAWPNTGETDQLRRRHAEYYCQLEARLSERLGGREQLDASRQLAAERDNALAAVNYAVDVLNVDLALRLVRNNPSPGLQFGFALLLPISVILDLPGATSHDLYSYALRARQSGPPSAVNSITSRPPVRKRLKPRAALAPSMNDFGWNFSSP